MTTVPRLSTQSSTYVGAIDFSSSNALAFSDGAGINGAPLIGSDISVKLASGTSLFGLLEARAAYTPANAGAVHHHPRSLPRLTCMPSLVQRRRILSSSGLVVPAPQPPVAGPLIWLDANQETFADNDPVGQFTDWVATAIISQTAAAQGYFPHAIASMAGLRC